MARRDDIETAFERAVKMDPKGKRTITTVDFVSELKVVNWEWSLKQANEWIEHYTHNFSDISTQEGEARTFYMFNPNGGR